MFKKLFLFIVLAIIVGLAGLYFGRNILVEKSVEEGGEYALGVKTDLGSADLGLSSGSCELNDFTIENPEGYNTDQFFSIKKGMLDIETGSIFDDEVVIDSLILDGVRINLEQIDKKSNFTEILNHINKFDFGESSSSDRTFKIKKVAISDVEVNAILSFLGKEQFNDTYTLNDFTLTDVGGSDGGSIEEITSELVKELVGKAIASNKNKLSAKVGEQLDALKKDGAEKVGTEIKKLGESLLGK